MNVYLLKMVLFGGIPKKTNSPPKASILDLSDESIGLVYKHLGIKGELAGQDLCNASGAFHLAMTCTRLRKIFQRVVRKIDASDPCTNSNGDTKCTCRSIYELQFKAFVAGPTLKSIQLPHIGFRSINFVLEFYARFCPNLNEVSFNDGGFLEKFPTNYLCDRLNMKSVDVRSPSKRFLEFLKSSTSRFTKLILTEVKPECVPTVRDLIRSRSSTLKVLNISVSLEGLWSQMDGFVAAEILCHMLTAAADEVVEIRTRYGPPIEIFEISGNPVRTKQLRRGVKRKIYLASGKQIVINTNNVMPVHVLQRQNTIQ